MPLLSLRLRRDDERDRERRLLCDNDLRALEWVESEREIVLPELPELFDCPPLAAPLSLLF